MLRTSTLLEFTCTHWVAIHAFDIGHLFAGTSIYYASAQVMLKSYAWHNRESDVYFNPKEINHQFFPHK